MIEMTFIKKSQEKNSKQSLTSEVAKDFKISGNINNKNVSTENKIKKERQDISPKLLNKNETLLLVAGYMLVQEKWKENNGLVVSVKTHSWRHRYHTYVILE